MPYETLHDVAEEDRLDAIRSHLGGSTTSPLFLLDACRWLVDEVDRLQQAQEDDQ
jgi:hypothetical protein